MTPSQVETRITDSFERTRPGVPIMVQRLAITYGVPMGAAVLLSTLGSQIFLALLPDFPVSTATILILAANLFILLRGVAWLEQRYEGTKLFLLYNTMSRSRRDLKRLIKQSPFNEGAVNTALQQLTQYEKEFLGAAAVS